ncbi:MAG: ABC transporter ATP-binding protein, partial [bacterium]|nr:ABC transporter ATP-binding protein [bacterium]
AQILDLMLQLQTDYGTAIMMITHDLGVIAEVAGRVVVMYAGRVVEEAHTLDIFQQTKHPYTEGLLKSIPQPGDRYERGRERLDAIKGTVPNLYNLPTGCSFAPRCADAMDVCHRQMPELRALSDKHKVRCWKYIEH